MTRLKKEVIKNIEKAVDKYIKTFDIIEKKDGKSIKTGNSLTHEPETLQNFFVSGIMLGLTKEARLYAKMYFKEKLPYKDWVKSIRSDPQALGESMLHYRKLQEEEY